MAANLAAPDNPEGAPGRTLWHAIYVPEESSLLVSFYLGEEPGNTPDGLARIRRSDYLSFRLER